MAKQTGLLKINGTLDNITFYRTKDGYLAKMKTRINASRIANDPAFARTRENGKEFGNSAKSGKLFRDTLRPITMHVSGANNVARITQLMSKIKNFDTSSVRGQRNVGIGITNQNSKALLKGFEFNEDQRTPIIKSLGTFNYAILRNHGVLVCGKNIPQTFVDYHYLETACKIQINALSGDSEFSIIDDAICEKAALQYQTIDPNKRGGKDWPACLRLLDRLYPGYRT